MGGVKIAKRKNMTMKEDFYVYNKPQYVYIPLIAFHDENVTLLIKKGDYVCKGDVIARKKGDLKLPIFSSVSGKFIDIEEHMHSSGKLVKCVVIENDFKEKVKSVKKVKENINEYSKQEFIDIVKNSGIIGLGGAGFPTYAKYDTETKINSLIINAVECEPYITCDTMFIKDHIEELLECIDSVMTINNIEKCYIAVKKENDTLITVLEEFLGSYLNIELKLVKNLYPMGWERLLVKEILNITYDKLPIEKGVVVNNISTIYQVYESLKYGKPLIERVVTFSGEGLNIKKNILVKIGTKIDEVLNSLGYPKEELILICGGPMMGISTDPDLIITPDVNSILVLKNDDEKVTECIRCGKCSNACPANLFPVLIKDFYRNKDKLQKLNPNKCVECGLCSYVCPAKINVREYVRKAKNIMREK